MVSCGWWKRINHFNPRHPYGWRPGLSAFRTNGRLFQSTPPIRVATSNVVFKPCERLFQSTPPIRVATMGLLIRFKGGGFQSTPPIRVATPPISVHFGVSAISIHATHTGGDKRFFSCAVNDTISIHATHTGGDSSRRTNSNAQSAISIHATHTGGDSSGPKIGAALTHFNPRHPYGWRHLVSLSTLASRNFNPRHPYGWRHEPPNCHNTKK